MTTTPSKTVIRTLPKVDLHSHIDGSVAPKELFRIAAESRRKLRTLDGADIDSVTAFMRYIEGDGYTSLLETVVDRFFPITDLMQTEQTIREVGVSYIKGQSEDSVAYVEGRFAPQYHTREGLSLDTVIRSMAEGLAEGGERYGVGTSLILAIGRESPPALGADVARAAVASRRAVAIDLGGPEVGNPPDKFRDAFRLAATSGMKLTVHAGEGAGSREKNLEYMEAAINTLGANRIGHAIDVAGDERLLELVRAKSVALEMNPVSNLVLGKIRDLRDLGVGRLLEAGINASLNSDDPALWPGGSLSDVFYETCKAYMFGMEELDKLTENAIAAAFCPDHVKESLLEKYRNARRRLA